MTTITLGSSAVGTSARRLVSKIQHVTGSRFRGEIVRDKYDRKLLATAIRSYPKYMLSSRRPLDISAALTQLNPAWRAGHRMGLRIVEPKVDRFRAGHCLAPSAAKHSR